MGKENVLSKVKQEAIKVIDENGNGQIDIEDFIIKAMKTPGIRIQRDSFLRKELTVQCGKQKTEEAIRTNPRKAGIDAAVIDKIADNVIKLERNKATISSTGLAAIPGEVAVQVATTAADLTQYYVFLIRVAQKLMYLYGFPQLGDKNEDGSFVIDSGTMNLLMLSIGAMYGLQEAVKAIKWVAKGFAVGTQKALMKKALTKGVIYPLVKAVFKKLSVSITKEIFTKFIANSIMFVGSVLCGGITYFSFDSCCSNFKAIIKETALNNPDNQVEEPGFIEADFTEEEEEESDEQ